MANHLGMDPVHYQKEYDEFMVKLKKFHNSKGTPFKRPPWLGGQYLDIFLLYKKVVSFGGWVKVTEDKRWKDVAECFNLPATCTNAAFALRQHYSRYLEAFERINFFGEDAEDVLVSQNARPHTPVSVGLLSGTSDYTSVISNKDPAKNFEKLILSLECGLPNEVDFAINVCMLLSNVSNSVFNLTKAPAVVEMLLAHTGVFCEESHSLKEVHKEWYQNSQRDFIKFWKETIQLKEMREYLCEPQDMNPENGDCDDESDEVLLFHPKKKIVSSRDVEAQRVFQVCMILHNFSFDVTNASVLATHPVCQRFLVMCVCSRLGCLQKIAWQTLSNLAEKMVLEAIESESTQMFFQMLHIYLVDKDRFHVLSAMDVLGKVCLLEYNDEVIESGLEVAAYEALVKVLMVPDIKLLIGSLETLYNLTGVGQVTSNYVSNVVHSIDILVCLVTLEVESFGSDVLAKVRLIENKAPVPKAVIAKPQPNQSSTLQGVPAPTPQTPTTSSANSRNEVDADTFTQNWISAFYEVNPSCSVSRIDLYADYLSCCSKLARVGILNATAFNRILKSVFPSAQLRRVQSSSQLQYAIQGICRRSNPLPVKSKLDLPDTTSTLSQQIHGSALQRGFSSSQNISQVPNRTPTPPTPSQQQTWSQSGQAQNQTRPIVANLSMAHTHVVQKPASPVTVTKTYQRPSTSPALQQGQRPGFPGQATQRLQNVWKAQQSNQLQGLDLRQAQTLQTQVQPKRLAQSPHSGSLQQPVQGGNLQPQKVISQTTCNAGNLQRPTAAEQTALQRQQPQQQQQTFRQQQEQLYRQRQQQLQQMRQQMHSENQAAMLRRSSHGQTPPPVLPAQTSPRPQQVSNQAQSNRPVQPGIQQQLHGVQHVPHQTNQFVVQQAQLSIRASNGLSHSSLMPQINTPNATATSTYRAPLVSGASNKVSQSPALTQASQQSPVVMPVHSQLPSNQKQFSPIARKPDFGQESQIQTSLRIPVNSQIQPQVRTNVQVTQAQRLLLPSPQGLTTPGQAQSREQSTMQGSLQLSVGGVPAVQQVIRVNSRQSKAQPTQNFVSCSNTPKTNSAVSGDGVVLVAREERAEDVVTSELMKEAKEARIVMVENVRLAGSEPGMIKARLESNDLKPELHEISRPVGSAINNSVSGGLNGPAHCKEQHRGIDVPNFDSSVSVDNSNKINKNSRPTSLDTNSVGLGEIVDNTTKKEKHSNNEPYVPSPTKKPRLDTKLPSLDSDILDSPTDIRRSDSPSSLVNGDIRLDSKNRFMDKLLGKDLHLPLNGVCGIDASDLDVGISSEEDPLSSRKSSPDIFDSCNNSDFDQFLEDNALFGDVLTGDLRVDSDSSAAKTDISLEQSNSQSMQENGLRNSTSVSEATNTRTVNPFMDCTKSAGLPVQNSVTSDKGRIASSSENRTIAPNYKEILTNSRFDIPQQIPVNQVQRVPNTVSSNPAMYNQLNGDNVRNTPTFNSIQEPSSRVIAANAPPYFDNRTKGVATPGALVSEPSMQHGQQQSTPPSPMSPVVKSGIVASDATSPKLTPFTSTVPSPVTETSKPYRCHWDVCLSSFDSSKQLLSHMVSEHVPVNSLLMACQWQGCTPVRRSRSSLIFHLQQKHLDPSSQSAAGTASSSALPRPKPAISQEPVQAQQAFVPQTFQFMARMLQALQADEESPLTKTVRLTAALVLRNVAQYSAVARSLLRRHERSLVQVAMSNSEASQAAAACLAELSPHRKSPEREATFSWALDS